MGLDMYLFKKTKSVAMYGNAVQESTERTEDIGYWRKANQIHRWFVENAQNDIDDCATYVVTAEKLKKLLNTCKIVKQKPELDQDLLPTTSGFFFGSTAYDQYYMQDIDDTIEILEKALKDETPNTTYHYYASW